MTAPMQVYKEAGKWFFDCRVCNTSNPHGAATQGIALTRAEMHYDVAHTYSAFSRAYDLTWSRT